MPKKDTTQLKQFLKPMTKGERVAFAEKCGTTLGNLYQVIYSTTSCSADLAIAIDRESNGAVRCDDLRPSADFSYLRNQCDPLTA
ncbi:helix-turn-helix domain-containing protein [Acinetobacter qingfengensis]|uniref:Uncharacterized protein n=1 Tax=Acinetobacter qingfengensis TaxID=1262585 RepID=A0A1E7QYR3_9GAMM|nr:YdaS family helix-turn-helix protein [Acinetobacter qingfengensis]KAA8731006.1 helix-turn-helix domain-containing protein [Acinetobacter qingfengensis]OEY92215.1 hypothetical protein BJI46_05540 [Acinetobacter qingfengensis]